MPRGVHPNSLANLKRGKRFGDGDDNATIDARKSAEKSNQKRKEKKNIVECMEMILNARVVDEAMQKRMSAMFDVKGEDQTYAALITIAMVQKAIKGDVSAAKLAIDLSLSQENDDDKLNAYLEGMKNAKPL